MRTRSPQILAVQRSLSRPGAIFRIHKGPLRPCTALLAAWLVLAAAACATTLQQLSLDEMIRQSSGIVRAKVTGSRAAFRGQTIYTYYTLHVLEAPKPVGKPEIEVAVAGGVANGVRQVAIGSPELRPGSEYVVFLWTGKSGMNQILGLSQGLFQTARDASGNINLTRPAADEPMLDKSGRPVASAAMGIRWDELRSRIRKELGR